MTGKMMISLSDETEARVREAVEREFHNKVGGLSIFFERLVRLHFVNQKRRRLK